jgi:chromosome segregation ATPase
MRRFITAALAVVGLAPAGHVEHARNESERAARRLHDLEARLVESKADAEQWKRRHDECTRRVADHQEAASRAATRAERAEARAEELKARSDALAAEMKEMRARLQDAHRATSTVREHLMATETKLDLIEAALQVLDARTRAAAVPQPAEKLRT